MDPANIDYSDDLTKTEIEDMINDGYPVDSTIKIQLLFGWSTRYARDKLALYEGDIEKLLRDRAGQLRPLNFNDK